MREMRSKKLEYPFMYHLHYPQPSPALSFDAKGRGTAGDIGYRHLSVVCIFRHWESTAGKVGPLLAGEHQMVMDPGEPRREMCDHKPSSS